MIHEVYTCTQYTYAYELTYYIIVLVQRREVFCYMCEEGEHNYDLLFI